MKTSKTILCIVLGIIFWFNAAMIIRFTGDRVFTENNAMLPWFYLLAIPATALSIYITKLLCHFSYSQLLRPVVIMTFTATFLDGIALAWFKTLYSDSMEVVLHGAAWILWAVGLGLLIAYYLERRAPR
jgi:hypothetical protein